MSTTKVPRPRNQQLKRRLMMALIRLFAAVYCRIAPAAAARWANRLFHTPGKARRPRSELAYFDSATRSTITFQGHSVAQYEWGHGEQTVVVAHGWGSRVTRLGPVIGALVAEGYHVMGVDQLGHGNSGCKQTNLREITELLTQIIHEHAPVIAVIGHSFGGTGLANAIHKHDLPVPRMVIIASPFSLEFEFGSFIEMINLTEKVGRRVIRELEERWMTLHCVDIYDYSPDRFTPALTLPALVIHDEEDGDVAFSEGQGWAAALPNSRFVGTKGLGHRRILRNTGVIEEIVQFVKG